MTRLDDKRQFATSKRRTILKYIQEVKTYPNLKPEDFKSKSIFSGGTLITVRQDAKSMEIVGNGMGIHITELGTELLQNASDPSIWRKVALNVPVFKRILNEFPDEKDYRKIKSFVGTIANSIFLDKRLIGSVARRYLEYVYGINQFPKAHLKRESPENSANNLKNFMQLKHEVQIEVCTVTVTKGDKKLFTVYDVPVEKAKLLID